MSAIHSNPIIMPIIEIHEDLRGVPRRILPPNHLVSLPIIILEWQYNNIAKLLSQI